MPISLWRGALVYWRPVDAEGHTRKGVEKGIKALSKRLAELEVATDRSQLKAGGWEVYLTVEDRLNRGKAMGHCLGSEVGQAGVPYIAVGYRDETYGYWLETGTPVLDQAYGRANAPLATAARHPQALALAQEYASRATWSGSSEIAELRYELEVLRRQEFVLNRLAGRWHPGVEFDQCRDQDLLQYSSELVTAEQHLIARELRLHIVTKTVWYGCGVRPRWARRSIAVFTAARATDCPEELKWYLSY